MNATAAHVAPVVTLTGKISNVDPYPRIKPKRFNTLIRLAAPDEFTTPSTVEVTSEQSIGVEGQVVTVKCEVGGRYRSYPVTDKNTGEERTVRTADNLLTVVG